MRFLAYNEAIRLGLEPYAVYGGQVYSFKVRGLDSHPIPHGSLEYASWVSRADGKNRGASHNRKSAYSRIGRRDIIRW